MRTKPLPTIERLRELLDVDEKTGILTWKVYRSRGARAGSVAGNPMPTGYREIKIDGSRYLAHRVVWKMVWLEEPPMIVDHIDRDRSNNAPINLRAANHTQNSQNSVHQKGMSGVRGVHFDKSRGRWLAYISVKGKFKNLGRFESMEAAVAARIAAGKSLRGDWSIDT